MNDKFQCTANTGYARFLTAHFEGYFMCRLATDPDPTNETRGMSGYTMALASEDHLDQVLRLNVKEDYLDKNLRAPGEEMGLYGKLLEGVRILSVSYDGKPVEKQEEHPLFGAKLSLLGRDGIFEGPTFESRNNITGSDDTMAFVVDPFHLRISKERPGGGEETLIEVKDYLDPLDPAKQIWQIMDPAVYGRRLSTDFKENSQEVAKAINVFDLYGYFYDRRRFLQNRIAEIERETDGNPTGPAATEIEECKSRIYQLEFWGDRVISKLGTMVTWAFEINGPKQVTCDLHGKALMDSGWPITFWCGGWDGDLLIGYMRGDLNIPFERA